MTNNKKTIYIVINPVSGTGSKWDIPQEIASILSPYKFDTHILITGYAGHGYEIAKKAVEDKVDYVIAVGGDGTVNEVARALVNTDTVLGIIPLGSGNGLGRDLNIPTNVKKALNVIAEENIVKIDYGLANGHHFFCTCGVGFDAIVAEKASGNKKRGSLMYFKHMLDSFFSQTPKEYEIVLPDGVLKNKAFVVTCANASQYGYNAHIAPHADVSDGLMNLAILQPLGLLDVPKTAAQLFTRNIDSNKKMLELLVPEVTIKREEEGVMHIDGDPIQMGKEIHVKIVPQGLNVIVPESPPVKSVLDPQEMFLSVLRAIFN